MKFLSVSLLVLTSVILFSCGPDTESEKVYPKATHIYFSGYSQKEVGVVDVNAIGSYDVIADNSDGLDTVSGIAIDFIGGKIYAAEELKNRIVRFNIDGSGLEVLYDEGDSVKTPTSITFHEPSRTLYWANSGTGQIKKGSMDGGSASSIKFAVDSVITYCYGLAVNSENKLLFFSDLMYSDDDAYSGIRYAKTDGTEIDGFNTIIPLFTKESSSRTVLRNPSSIFLDEENRRIYWADEGLKAISVGVYSQLSATAISPGSSTALYNAEDNVNRADGVAVDMGNKKIYWTETGETSQKIIRANLDGSGEIETVLDGVESYGIVLKFDGKK